MMLDMYETDPKCSFYCCRVFPASRTRTCAGSAEHSVSPAFRTISPWENSGESKLADLLIVVITFLIDPSAAPLLTVVMSRST